MTAGRTRQSSPRYAVLRARRRRWMMALVLAAAVMIAAVAAASSSETYRDEFATGDYSGNDGSASWSGPWEELGLPNGPNQKNVKIESSPDCPDGVCLALGWPSLLTEWGIQRTANLAGATGATLEYDYRIDGHPLEVLSVVTVSVSDGGGWTTVATYPLDEDTAVNHAAFDISAFISTTTRIRFAISLGTLNPRFHVDNVTITASSDAPPITSTTTTTTEPTTTTAATTTLPVATTTTVVGSTTTSTGGATTTSVGPGSTPTTAAEAADASTTTIALSPEEAAVEALNSPVMGLGPSFMADAVAVAAANPAPGPDPMLDLPGIDGLLAGYSTTVERTAESVLPYLVLAVVVAWLSVRGLEAATPDVTPDEEPPD